LASEEDRPVADVMTSSVEALRAYNEGLDRLRKAENQEAIAALTAATTSDASFAVAWAKLGDAYLNAGRGDDALKALDRASALADQKQLPLTERYLIHAAAARLRDDYETAAKSYLELAALDPQDGNTQLSLARIYEEMGHFQEAGDAYAKALELAPDSTEALFGLSWARLQKGNAREAIRLLDEPLQSGRLEGNAEALGMLHSILGVSYRELADFEQAKAHLEKSFQYRVEAGDNRGQRVTLNNLSQIYSTLGQLDQAIEAQQKALALARQIGDREGESDSLLDLAETFKMANRLDEALAALRDSMQIEREREDDANLALRLTSIGDVYRQKGQYDDALVYLEQAKSLIDRTRKAGDAAANLIYIGMVRKEQGLFSDAIEALLESLSLGEQAEDRMASASSQRMLGEIYRDQGRYQDAFAAMSQSLDSFTAIHAEHDIAELKPLFAGLLVRVGLYEEAEKQLDEVDQLNAQQHHGEPVPETLLARGELAFARGDLGTAAARFREADRLASKSQKWDVAIRSRVALAQLDLGAGGGKRAEARGLLERALAQAKESRLRPVEAEAEAGLAEARLAMGDATAALEHAQRSVAIAKKLEARPTLCRAYAAKGEAERSLGRGQEATQSFVEVANLLRWMRGSLDPKHVDSFVARTDVQALAGSTADRLAEGGQTELAAELTGWTGAKARAASTS
jgi:tetratricopeptide (TPR) repeat protein